MTKGIVKEVIANPALKRDGTPIQNKPGQKPWTMSRVKAELDDGTTQEGNVFNPVQVGEEIEAEYNEQYSSWNFSKVKPPKPVSEQETLMINMLKDIGTKLDGVGEAVGAKFALKNELPVKSEQKIAEEAETGMDEPIDLSEIPF